MPLEHSMDKCGYLVWSNLVIYLDCNSGTVDARFWEYWTISEKSNAKQLRLTSFFPLLIDLSSIVVFNRKEDILRNYERFYRRPETLPEI